MKTNKKNLLPFHVISAAARGDIEAIGTVLGHYDGYISSLCTRKSVDDAGNTHYYIDEEMKNRLKIRLIMRTLAFQVK